MPVMDDIREQTRKMKDMTWKERFAYYWGYYKIHTIAGIVIIVLAIWFIHDMVTKKDEAFYGLFVNADGYSMSEEADERFAEYAGIDTDKEDVFLDATVVYNVNDYTQDTYYSAMKISSMLAAKEVDVMTSNAEVFYLYALNETFAALDEVLTPEQLESYGLQLYYIDRAEVETHANEEVTPLDREEMEPLHATQDPKDPSVMKDPVAVGIYMKPSEIPFFSENGCYSAQDEIVFGFIVNSGRKETAVSFLEYIMK